MIKICNKCPKKPYVCKVCLGAKFMDVSPGVTEEQRASIETKQEAAAEKREDLFLLMQSRQSRRLDKSVVVREEGKDA